MMGVSFCVPSFSSLCVFHVCYPADIGRTHPLETSTLAIEISEKKRRFLLLLLVTVESSSIDPASLRVCPILSFETS